MLDARFWILDRGAAGQANALSGIMHPVSSTYPKRIVIRAELYWTHEIGN
jgi:hypothetical protein